MVLCFVIILILFVFDCVCLWFVFRGFDVGLYLDIL